MQKRLQLPVPALKAGCLVNHFPVLCRESAVRSDEAQINELGSLADLLRHAADSIESDNLVAEFNAADLQRLKGQWETFAGKAVPGKTIRLSPEPCSCRGGVRVRSEDNRIRVDNSFEGRIERMNERLQQSITERLFAGAINKGGLIRG